MSRTIFVLILSIGVCVFSVGCSTTSAQLEVVSRFGELKQAGDLPGFSPDDHGNLKTEGFPVGHRINYPASIVIYATKKPDPDTYIYTFKKESDGAKWELIEASRELENGTHEDLDLK